MNLKNLLSFCFLFTLSASAAYGAIPTCTDWSQSIGLPGIDPSITGSQCQLDGTTCYVAGSDFMVVDLSDTERAVVLGRIPLSASPYDILVRGDYVYLLLKDFGLVEVDVSIPESPVLNRDLSSDQGLFRVADIDPYLAVLDNSYQVHVLDVTHGQAIAEISVQHLPINASEIGRIGNYLALRSTEYISIMDFSDPLAGVETSSIRCFQTSISISPEEIIAVTNDGPMESTSSFRRITVDDSGLAQIDWWHMQYFQPETLVANGGMFFAYEYGIGRNGLFDSTDGDLLAVPTFSSPPRSRPPAIDLNADLLVAVSESQGLAWLDLATHNMVAPILDFGAYPHFRECWDNGVDSSTCTWYAGEATNRYWIDQWVRRTVSMTGTYYSIEFKVFDLAAPRSPVLAHEGYIHNFGPSSRVDVRILGERWLASTNTVECGPSYNFIYLVDLITGTSFPRLEGASSPTFGGELVWAEVATVGCDWELIGYRPLADGSLEIAVNLGPNRSHLGCFDDVAIVREEDTILALDYSDPQLIVELSAIPVPDGVVAPTWVDRTLFFADNLNGLWSADFTDPALPVSQFALSAPYLPVSIQFDGNEFLLQYQDDGLQVGQLTDDGTPVLTSPVFGDWIRDSLLFGHQVYAGNYAGVLLYDVSDPSAPAFIGQALDTKSDLAVIGGFLVHGGSLLELDCGVAPDPILTMTPLTDPVEISPNGGRFHFSILFETPAPVTVQPVFEAVLPDGSSYTVNIPLPLVLEAGTHQWPDLIQNVPDYAPAGEFLFRCEGTTSDGHAVTGEFAFTKLTSGPEGMKVGNWNLAGWEENPTPNIHEHFIRNHGASPNPFNPSTTIHFELMRAGRASVQVFDLAGRLVRTLASGLPFEAGPQSLEWNGRTDRGEAVSSGLYFYRIEIPNETATGRMFLVK